MVEGLDDLLGLDDGVYRCVVHSNEPSAVKVCAPFWYLIAWGVWGHVSEDESAIGFNESQTSTFVAVGIEFMEI